MTLLGEVEPWQEALARAYTDPAKLLDALGLPHSHAATAPADGTVFKLRVPREFVSRMQRGNPDDPLLRQVLPLDIEFKRDRDFSLDPVGDLDAMNTPGLLRKYHGRALLIAAGACAVHCRYCFRRHFPYTDAKAMKNQWASALCQIQDDASISEIILSGGDPLILSDSRLSDLIERLETIEHLKRLRIHTRLPIVLPSRITQQFCQQLRQTRLKTVVVLHVNHPNEIDESVTKALAMLPPNTQRLNQTVLLRGVNDTADTLATLSERLFDADVLPYYLHLLDRVQGAAHFEVDHARAKGIYKTLLARLPGYLVPRLVREKHGEPNKLPVIP